MGLYILSISIVNQDEVENTQVSQQAIFIVLCFAVCKLHILSIEKGFMGAPMPMLNKVSYLDGN